jgi:hypothetical protein
MKKSRALCIFIGFAITLTNPMVAAYTVGPELIPDPEFNDPTKWEIVGLGGSVTDSHLVFINANVIRAAPIPDVLASIGQDYQYSIVVNEFTYGLSARILFGGVDLWTQDNGIGTFVNTFTATGATGLVAQALPATYKIDSISIKAITSVPLPAATWLFGSGLLGIIGVARKKIT